MIYIYICLYIFFRWASHVTFKLVHPFGLSLQEITVPWDAIATAAQEGARATASMSLAAVTG